MMDEDAQADEPASESHSIVHGCDNSMGKSDTGVPNSGTNVSSPLVSNSNCKIPSPLVKGYDSGNSTPRSFHSVNKGGDATSDGTPRSESAIDRVGSITPRSDGSTQPSRDPTPSLIKNLSGNESQGEDVEAYINPEPPPELVGGLLNADNIGETVFSKHWLFTILMRLIQTVDSEENNKEQQKNRSEQSTLVLDIDDDLQDELCKLWDMSMNPEVVKFLQEFKAIDILTGVISKSRAPRATEICVGILGNMACNDEVCVAMGSNEKLREMLLVLFETPDAPTLVELTRLLHVCISCPSAAGPWLDTIKKDQSIFTHVSFILQSSTNGDLLRNTGEFVGAVLYTDDEACEKWSTPEIVLGVLEALKQLGSHPTCESLETFLHILQLISTCEPGVEALVSYGSDLISLTMKYLVSVCEEDLVGIDGKENSLGSALSVVNVLLASWEDSAKFIQEDFQLLRCVLKILEELLPAHSPKKVDELARQRSRSDCSISPPPFSSYSTGSQKSTVEEPSQGSSKSQDQAGASHNSWSQEATGASTSTLQGPHEESHDSMEISPSKDDKQCHDDQNKQCHEDQNKQINESTGNELSLSNGDRKSIKEEGGMKSCASKSSLASYEYEKKMVQMLYEVIQTCLVEMLRILKQVCFPLGIQESESASNSGPAENESHKSNNSSAENQSEVGIPETLEYLDTKCQSLRIRYMLYLLKDAQNTDGTDFLHIMHLLAQKYDAHKIIKILSCFY